MCKFRTDVDENGYVKGTGKFACDDCPYAYKEEGTSSTKYQLSVSFYDWAETYMQDDEDE